MCDVHTFLRGAQWCPDDTIVFGEFPGGIFRISANGGIPEPLFEEDMAELAENNEFRATPQILPDGKNVLFTSLTGIQGLNSQITIQSLESGGKKPLFQGDFGKYVRSGHIIYSLDNGKNLHAVPFDLERLEVIGESVPLPDKAFGLSVSDSGTCAYALQPGAVSQSAAEAGSADVMSLGRTLWWVDRNGNEELINAPPNIYRFPKISPDGSKVGLAATIDGNEDIQIWDLVRENLSRLTFHKATDSQPIWSPDGKQIVFMSERDGQLGIYSKSADGTGVVKTLCSDPELDLFPWSWSDDGNTLVIMEGSGMRFDIGTLSMEGDGVRKLLLKEEHFELQPQISPNGQWIAYLSNESGELEIYVRPFPEVEEGKWQVSIAGADAPRWSPDGHKLFYFAGTGDAVMEVPVETEPTFSHGKPKLLFRGSFVTGFGESISYDIHPDGRFLMIKPPPTKDQSAFRKIIVITNWFEELKERVPTN